MKKRAQGHTVGIQMQARPLSPTHSALAWAVLSVGMVLYPPTFLGPGHGAGAAVEGPGWLPVCTQLSFMPWSCSAGKDWSPGSSLMGAVPAPHPILLSSTGTALELWSPSRQGPWGCDRVDSHSSALEQELEANPCLSPGPQPCPWSPSSCLLEPVGIGAAPWPWPPTGPASRHLLMQLAGRSMQRGWGPRSDSHLPFLPSLCQTVEARSACQTASAESARGAKNGIFLSLEAFM